MKRFLRIVGFLVAFFIGALSLLAVWKVINLSSEDRFVEIIKQYFDSYGYWIVFVSAFIEGVILIGWYYPGSLVMFLGVILAGKDISEVVWVVGLATAGLFFAYLLNYSLGKYGWYRLLLRFGLREPIEKARASLTKHGLRGILLSYWQPNLAALTSTAAGVLRFSFKKFALYSAVAVILWNIFWGGLVYFFGEVIFVIVGIRFLIIVITVWFSYLVIFKKQRIAPKIL